MQTKHKLFLASCLAVLLMLTSWFINMGWFRLIGTFLLIPVSHAVFFIMATSRAANYFDSHRSVRRITLFSFITFLLPHLLIPDGGDIGPMYLFFGLIRNDSIAHVTHIIGCLVFIAHIVLLIWQFSLHSQYAEQEESTPLGEDPNP